MGVLHTSNPSAPLKEKLGSGPVMLVTEASAAGDTTLELAMRALARRGRARAAGGHGKENGARECVCAGMAGRDNTPQHKGGCRGGGSVRGWAGVLVVWEIVVYVGGGGVCVLAVLVLVVLVVVVLVCVVCACV